MSSARPSRPFRSVFASSSAPPDISTSPPAIPEGNTLADTPSSAPAREHRADATGRSKQRPRTPELSCPSRRHAIDKELARGQVNG
ncbi:hypothetical protein PMIN01_07196 [Paraphaeosphaeria minitans]|uniref:Uncharacterized protein n=1 Tax=Paraphaeosphaeria minitans TaxID=565426 RepID=A0A9P6GFT8_9PLEO|nr:hypothetical protein PMIN01_07196 [Paraphaeosphaeria minitans]